MADSPLNQIGSIAIVYAMLAAATLPIAFALRILTTGPSRDRPLRLATAELLVLILFAYILPANLLQTFNAIRVFEWLRIEDASERNAIASILGGLIWIAIFTVWCSYRGVRSVVAIPAARWQRDIAAGIFGFVILTPITFAVYLAACAILEAFGGQPDQHPLTNFDVSAPQGVVLFIASACVFAPIIEEMIFRGMLLPWASQRRVRPWIIFALGLVMLIASKGIDHLGIVLFAVDLAAMMAFAFFGRQVWKKWPSRTASAIASTAALFGAMHATVWPTPIPLTVLGLGLGILAVRRGSVRPAIIAHGLFNAVSVIYVLRRGS